ncbi:MAG: penicillin-binding transpeptidase domain-containing protein [Oscillospiraceae bacterium]
MKRIYKRTVAALLVVVMFICGFGLYLIRYITKGDDWVTFGVNRHAYVNGVLMTGSIFDANGNLLAGVSEDNSRIFSDDYTTRRATLHVVGDAGGNIGTGLLNSYATTLMGYDLINGAYSRTGKGNSIYTTLDSKLCSTALNALGSNKGAVAVYNYKTGAVVCMVSSPGFDPLDPPDIAEGDKRYDGAYINRAISSAFTPGSVFKLVTLAAAIENIDDLWDREFNCTGEIEVDGEIITCSGVHGKIGIKDALAESCNVAFAQLSLELGAKTIERYAKKAGLLDTFKMGDLTVAKGSYELADNGTADLAWSGIGQYNDLVNPLSMARYMGAIAEGGRAVNPRIIQKVTTPSGFPAGIYGFSDKARLMSESTADTIGEMMRYNVTANYGDWRFPDLNTCAKSGTAEIAEGDTPHAWFTGFLDDDKNPYAFAVFVENGGWGVSVAGAVANRVLQQAVNG